MNFQKGINTIFRKLGGVVEGRLEFWNFIQFGAAIFPLQAYCGGVQNWQVWGMFFRTFLLLFASNKIHCNSLVSDNTKDILLQKIISENGATRWTLWKRSSTNMFFICCFQCDDVVLKKTCFIRLNLRQCTRVFTYRSSFYVSTIFFWHDLTWTEHCRK